MKLYGKGVPFEGFDHRFFVESETLHKQQVRKTAADILKPEKWSTWSNRPGLITEKLKAASDQAVCWKLLDFRYGMEKSGNAVLFKLDATNTGRFESLCVALAQAMQGTDQQVGQVVDEMANFFRQESLGCKWDFIAYLLFVLCPERYFPIKSGYFQKLLRFYGIDVQVVRQIEWSRYKAILDVAELLKEKLDLMGYGTATAIQIQSYMWVVACLKAEEIPNEVPPPNLADVLKERVRRAELREKIGVEGELAVVKFEQRRLQDAGLSHLAQRVELIAVNDESAGYDIASFRTDGRSLKIEVKSTMQSQHECDQFWVSENERSFAASDADWTLYRVWEALSPTPIVEDLGNIVRDESEDWRLDPASWRVQRRRDN